MENIKPEDLMVTSVVKLSEMPTTVETELSKKEIKKALEDIGKKLSKMQDVMYAHNRYGVLVCLQGMDTSGKDSLIREVFSKFNPRGMVVHSFKPPTSKELQYDYLWRHYVALPQKGKYSVFNRSHYENVLVTRVNPHYLLNENIPGLESVDDLPGDFWDKRMDQIRNFEKHIVQNGTIVFKFFLHMSKEEQRKRLLRRLEKEKKNWKFAISDLSERELWDEYWRYYEIALNNTSLPHAPWYIIPADSKLVARYLVAKVIYEEMVKYTQITEPQPANGVMENIEAYKQKLRKKEL
jgi:PPK2 family polyphosphate:nucleotide phosphotransferase